MIMHFIKGGLLMASVNWNGLLPCKSCLITMVASHGGCLQIFSVPGDELSFERRAFKKYQQNKGGEDMNVIIFIVGLVGLVILGFVAKSIFVVVCGAVGFAVSFLAFCASTMFSIFSNVFVYAIGIAAFAATIIFIPALLVVIIPLMYLAYLYSRKQRFYGLAREMQKLKYRTIA